MTARILAVDDIATNLRLLEAKLQAEYYEVLLASSGQEALQVAFTQLPDVILLDVMMPGMDGIETLTEIKKMAPRVEVILLTGYAKMELALKGMEKGAFDYLIKSIGIDELMYKLEDAYQKISIQEQKIKHIQAMIQSGK